MPGIHSMKKVAALAAMMVAGGAGAAVAATFSFSEDPRVITSPYTFSYNDLTVSVTGWNYTPPAAVGDTVTPDSPSDVVVNRQGLGVCENNAGDGKQCGNTTIDAVTDDGPELAVFTFSRAVTLSSISFNQDDTGERVDFLTSMGSFPLTYRGFQTFSSGGPNQDTFTLSLGSLKQLGIGVFSSSNQSDQVRISGFTLECDGLTNCLDDDGNTGGPSVVPLPAGLPLLASALGIGLFLRRRRA